MFYYGEKVNEKPGGGCRYAAVIVVISVVFRAMFVMVVLSPFLEARHTSSSTKEK